MVRRFLPLAALLAPCLASAAAPALVPVTGFLTDDAGAPVNDQITVQLNLYTVDSGGTSLWTEEQVVDVDNGQFTAYLGAETTLALETFRDNGMVYLGIGIDSGAEMTPRFEIATAPFAAYAQYCDDAATVGGIDPVDFRLTADELLWTDLTDVPASLADGDQDTLYTSGTGLTLTSGQFAVDQTAIEGFAKGVAYDSPAELRAQLDAVYLAKVSCTNPDDLLIADGTGGFACGEVNTLPIDASQIAIGTLPIGRLPTGTSATTVALGNHTHTAASIGALPTSGGALTGGLTGTTAAFSGGVSGTTGTFTGAVSGTTGAFSGGVSGTTGTFTGGLSGTTGTFTGNLNGTSAAFSGPLTGTTGAFTGLLTAATAAFTGSVKIGNDTAACSSANAGTLRYTTGVLQVCDGTTWTTPGGTSTLPNIPGLIVWVKADTGVVLAGSTVSTWQDQSGNGNNFVQATPSRQPSVTVGAINGLPALRMFSSASQTMTMARNVPAPATVIYVARMTGGSNARVLSGLNNNWLLGYHGGTEMDYYHEGWNYDSGIGATTAWQMWTSVMAGPTSTAYRNGHQINWSNAGVQGPNGLSLSGHLAGSEFSNCEIAEILVYNKALSGASVTAIERYLSTKYAL